jgi:aryl-alcohol dehydrogenase-like predicted oxidoreductase
MKLALGTVQFGMQYGIANTGEQTGQAEVERILAYALQSGVDMLDTAVAYGDSEACLGAAGVDDFRVVTKPPAEMGDDVESWVYEHLKASLKRLRIATAYGLLVHRSQQLLGTGGQLLARALARLKSEGLVAKIGVSIYDPKELELVTRECPIDLVQAPLNVFDRRLMTSGWLQRLHDEGVEVHVRSVFLQGLLLMPRTRVPERFSRWSTLFDRWHAWLAENHGNATEACLAFVNHPMVDRAVIGVDNLAQFKEVLQASRGVAVKELPDLACNDTKLVNPSNWNSL